MEDYLLIIVVSLLTIVNVLLVSLSLKMYTEYFKNAAMEKRKGEGK